MGGSSKQKPQVTQETQNVMGPEQRQVFDQAFPYAQQYAKTPLQQYGGSGIADFGPEEQQAQQMIRNQVGGINASAQRAQQTNNQLMDPDFMLNVANNPYLRSATDAMTGQMTRNLNENILPGVRSGAIQSGGMYSGGATKAGQAEAGAIGKTNQALSDTIADQYFRTYQQNQGQMGQAIDRNPGVMSQQLAGGEITGALGAQDRAMRQAQLDEQIRKFYTGQALPMVQAQELFKLIGAMPGGKTISTSTGDTPESNPFMRTIGGAGTGAAMGSYFGPLGMGLGGLIGGGMGYFGGR